MTSRLSISALSFIVMLVLGACLPHDLHAASKNLGSFGQTYGIAEKDALGEIRDRAAKVDWGKVFDKEKWKKRVKNYQPQDIAKLPKSTETRTRLVDMTYTLDFDIPQVDNSGNVTGVLYPKGYTFNPLDYADFPNTLVFINGADKNQLAWIKDSPYLKRTDALLMLTDGNWYNLLNDLKAPVYYARKILTDRLQVMSVPSVVFQDGNMLRVEEVNVDEYIAQKKNSK